MIDPMGLGWERVFPLCPETLIKSYGNGLFDNEGDWEVPPGTRCRWSGPCKIHTNGQECYHWIEEKGWWLFKKRILVEAKIYTDGYTIIRYLSTKRQKFPVKVYDNIEQEDCSW